MSLVLSWVTCVSLCAISLLRLIPLWRWLIRRLPGVLICWSATIRCSSVPFMRCRDWVSAVRSCASSIVPDARCGWGIRMPMQHIVVLALAAAGMFGLVDQRPLVPIDDPNAEHPVGLGRVGRLAEPVMLRDFARRVADVLPYTELGVQVCGDLDAPVNTVAVLPGSGDSLFDEVRATRRSRRVCNQRSKASSRNGRH